MTIPLTAPVSLNPDLALNGLEPTRNSPTTSPAPDAGPETLDFKAPRRAGPLSKIAKLPPEIRVIINQMLEDERNYDEIKAEVAKHGFSINLDNISKSPVAEQPAGATSQSSFLRLLLLKFLPPLFCLSSLRSLCFLMSNSSPPSQTTLQT
jgi:hypothetical protein